MNANININVDSIADALTVGRKKTAYDNALKEWIGSRSSFGLSDSLVSCDPTLMIGDKGIAPSAKPIPEGLDPIKIIVNGPATIVFWEDGTKTVVKCAKGETWDIYNAFTAALAIKVFGSNSKIKKILKTKVEWPVQHTERANSKCVRYGDGVSVPNDFTLDVKED